MHAGPFLFIQVLSVEHEAHEQLKDRRIRNIFLPTKTHIITEAEQKSLE